MTLCDVNWEHTIKTLLPDSSIFRITLFGHRATIKTVPMVNVLDYGANNPFNLLLLIFLYHCTEGGKKDTSYIASMLLPLIKNL